MSAGRSQGSSRAVTRGQSTPAQSTTLELAGGHGSHGARAAAAHVHEHQRHQSRQGEEQHHANDHLGCAAGLSVAGGVGVISRVIRAVAVAPRMGGCGHFWARQSPPHSRVTFCKKEGVPDGWDCLLAETPAYFDALKCMEGVGGMSGEMDDMTGLCLPNGPMHLFAYCE